MIEFRQKGDLSHLNGFFERLLNFVKMGELDKYGQMGVDALASVTPLDTGETASSWSYSIERTKTSASIIFSNSNVTSDGTPVAILLQYGHATGNGGYVQGIDYINPALRPVFQRIADDAWREVTQ